MESEDKKLYELAYLITPDLSDEEAVVYAERVKSLVSESAGEIHKEEAPRKRRLAYPIRHKTQGYFGYMHFFTDPGKIPSLTGKLSLDTNVLRHLLITVDKKQQAQLRKPIQSIAAQEKIKRMAQEKEKIEDTIFKEGAAAQRQEEKEKKTDLEELDKKLDEILNKEA